MLPTCTMIYINMSQGYTMIYICYQHCICFKEKLGKRGIRISTCHVLVWGLDQCWALLCFQRNNWQVKVRSMYPWWKNQVTNSDPWPAVLKTHITGLTLNQGSKSVLKLGQRTYLKPPILANHVMKSFSSWKTFKKPKIGGLLYYEILQKTQHQRVYDPMLGRYTILSY